MTQNDSKLLENYAKAGSEPAFTELVNRHIGLVYATALRQLNGSPHLAEDVTQVVFTSLAQKASKLTSHTSLAGWLYTSVRYAASDIRRSEQRRSAREQESYAMNQLSTSNGPTVAEWEQLRPVIDETMNELDDEDREAVLLRFFQGCSLAEVGTRLDLKENTARMRVDRALEKLRLALIRRGITSTAVVIAGSLSTYAMSVAPAGLATKVCRSILTGSTVAAGGGVATSLGSYVLKFLVAAGLAAAIAVPLIHHAMASRPASAPVPTVAAPAVAMTTPSSPATGATISPSASNAATSAEDFITVMEPRVDIHFDDPKTGKPVANVTVNDRYWTKDGFKNRQFYSDKNGWCEVTYPTNLTEIELTSELDGYADTRLEWHLDRGDKIPTAYTLHLAPAVLIGGQVVDANGTPVAGAKVGWNHEDDPTADTGPESHRFTWIETTTDADGRWQVNRIAEDMLQRIYGNAKSPGQVGSDLVFAGRNPAVGKALRDSTYVFKLSPSAMVTGFVVDADGHPVPSAKILVGRISSADRRDTTASPDGTFTVSGCKPGDNLVTASAPGWATTTIQINTTNDAMPCQLVLTRGKLLKIQVLDDSNHPVPHARAWLNVLNAGALNSPHYNTKRTQVDFQQHSDADGWLIWSNAPAGELDFQFSADGYVRSEDLYVTADGQDHVLTLHRALSVSGTARDADTGEAIPHFRMGIGWPEPDYQTGEMKGHWSSIARFWPEFSGGHYRNVMDEPAISGIHNPGYILRFEAEGYRTFISRVIQPNEGSVHLDVSLHRQVSTQITVIETDGQPAANTEVGLVSPGARLQLLPGSFSHQQSGTSILHTDAAGHFALPSDDAVTRVIIVNPSGYAETTPASLQATPTITLQPWGRIEATCLSAGRPVAGHEYRFELSGGSLDTVQMDFTAYKATSDDEGKFTLPMVPPGKNQLVRLIAQPMAGGHTSWTDGDKTEVDVQPEAATTITLGNKGYTVTAKLQWPDGAQPANIQNLMISLHTPFPRIPMEIRSNPERVKQYVQTPEFQALTKAVRSYPLSPGPDGTLSVDGVLPGNYTLTAFVMLAPEPGKSEGSMMTAQEIPVTIPADPPTGQLDVGTIELKQSQSLPKSLAQP